MAVLSSRCQIKHLRRDLGFEFHNQTHNPRLETPGPQQFDIRVVSRHLARQTIESAVKFNALNINHQTIWVFDQEMGVFKLAFVFEGDPSVIRRRPNTHGKNRRLPGSGPS